MSSFLAIAMTEATWQPRAETGLTFDEALEAAVCGYRVRYEGMQEGAYIHYEFDGWRIQFADSFGKVGEGSSSKWNPFGFDQDKYRLYSIMLLPSEVKRDPWGQPIAITNPASLTKWGKADDPNKDKWGR
jgi:hypothetical protein